MSTRADFPAPAVSRFENLRDFLLVGLAFGAGAVDAISFLGLGHVFTANMTGNIVLLGVAAGSGAGSESIRSGVSLVAFCIAVFVALWICRNATESRVPRGVVLALGLEAVAQAGFLTGWLLASGRPGQTAEVWLVGISALAMGLQSGAVMRLRVRGVSTTYVTGMLTGLISEVVTFSGDTRDWVRRVLVLAALLIGAACAAVMVVDARDLAPALPLAVTAIAGVGLAFSGSGDD